MGCNLQPILILLLLKKRCNTTQIITLSLQKYTTKKNYTLKRNIRHKNIIVTLCQYNITHRVKNMRHRAKIVTLCL
jgi:hypothetical protein